jgi:type I restriction enzyme S subunit
MNSDWQVTTLGDICKAQGGTIQTGPFGSQLHTSDYMELGTPVVMPTNIGDGGINIDGIARIGNIDVERLSQHKLRLDDIIFSRRGDVTKNALIRIHEVDWLCGTGCLKVRLGNETIANAKFISHCLRLPDIKDWLVRHAVGATMPNLNTGILSAVPINLPPLKYQIEIAKILGALDDRIALLRKTNATLEAIAQAMFKSWFVDFDPVRAKQEGREPEGMDAATAALFPDCLEESKLGLVPTGWQVVSLAEIMDIAGGTQPPASEFIDQLRPGYIRLIQIRDYETESHLTYIPDTTKLRKTSASDIMIARYGASVGRICWGLDGAYNVALVRVVCQKHRREYLRSYLKSTIFQLRLDAVSGRSAQAGFNKGDIASFIIVNPPDKLLEKYNETAWQIRKSILENKKVITTLGDLRDTLLPRLISGQLRLPDADAIIEEAAA